MGTNCIPLLANLFLYGYETEFIQELLKTGKKHLAQKINLSNRNIDHVMSLNNSKISELLILSIHVNLKLKRRQSPIYLPHTYIAISVLTMESLLLGDDFNFPIVNCPFLSSNIPSATECMSLN